MTLAVFTFVLLLGNIMKDIIALLANRNVDILTLVQFFLLLMPFVLSFSMPMALMAATLLVVGRFSADHELTASRSCGISLFELSLPLCGVAAALCFVCLFINCYVAPKTKYLFNRAFVDIALNNPIALLEEGQFIKDFQDMVIFINKRDLRTKTLKGVRIMRLQNNELTEDFYAHKATVTTDPERMIMKLTLYDAQYDQRDPQDPSNMTKRKWNATVAEYPLELDLQKMIDQRRAVREMHHYSSMEIWRQAQELKARGTHPTPMLVELHRRIALSLACLAFLLVAIPLGIRTHRTETSIGILMSLVLAVLYYFLIIFAESFKKHPQLYPEFIIWIPNLIFQAIGSYLLWRQHRV